MFLNPDMVRSNYVSKIDKEKCVGCGECVEACQVNALRLGQKICSKTPVVEPKRYLPHDTDWGPDKWNPDYRYNRKVVVDGGSSPCKAECPAHIGIQGYIKLAAQGRYAEALELIKRENPFPAVCGRICPRNCESACTRGEVDEPLAIDEIKKFIAERDLDQASRYVPQKRHNYGNKVAVVGAGPAGLSCAYYLALDGYKVSVFEKRPALGGMLTLGIPSFRLGKEVVAAEIAVLRELGVEFNTGVEVGKDIGLAELRSRGFQAFYLAIGAQAGRRLGIEGEDALGVSTGVDFLREVNLGNAPALQGRVVVIGGGNVAIDVARTAARSGAEKVELFCLEARDEMPALEEEIAEALAEDIGIENSWGPLRVLTKDGRVVGVEFQRCVSVFDAAGKFRPSFDAAVTRTVEADAVLVSVGQAIEWGALLEGSRMELNANATLKADATTYQTGEPDVFAGGDALTGPRFAIDAIAAGKEAAISIHRFVQPGQSLTVGRTKRDYRAFDKAGLELGGYDSLPRQASAHVDGGRSRGTFKDLRTTFTEEQVRKETERCLSCGATVVDDFLCVGCGVCTTKCKFDAISLVRKYDSEGLELREIRPAVLKYGFKRKLRIAAKKPFRFIERSLSRKGGA